MGKKLFDYVIGNASVIFGQTRQSADFQGFPGTFTSGDSIWALANVTYVDYNERR